MTPSKIAAERWAAFVEKCQRAGTGVFRTPNLIPGPRSGAVFLGSTLPVVPRDEFEFSWVGATLGVRSLSVVIPTGTLVTPARSSR